MNRRQKIIVSVTGIFLVLLVLVGLTYAFFLTRIKGNENPTSISVTTANLRLIYDDGDDGVIGGVNLIPSDEIYEKQFTVYNDGNVNTTYGLYLINVVNTFERKDDIQYTLGCSTDGELECKMNGLTTFPSGNLKMVENTIEPGVTHTYTFRFSYKETGTDQSVDMGKELSAKIQIFGKDGQFEYIPFDEETLAYNIVNNAKLNKNGTEIKNISLDEIDDVKNYTSFDTETVRFQIPGNEFAKIDAGAFECQDLIGQKEGIYDYFGEGYFIDEYLVVDNSLKIISCDANDLVTVEGTGYKTEKVLATAEDDYGTSYYYRGNVRDNYVNFAGMCWRIVRVQGDGSTKLILYNQNKTCEETATVEHSIGVSDASVPLPSSNNSNWRYGRGETLFIYHQVTPEYVDTYGLDTADYINDEIGMKRIFQNWFDTNSNFTNQIKQKIKTENWCIGDTTNVYDENENLLGTWKEAALATLSAGGTQYDFNYYYKNYFTLNSLKCNLSGTEGEIDKSKIGTLTASEALYAGLGNHGSYLYNIDYFTTLTPSSTIPSVARVYSYSGGILSEHAVEALAGPVPSIVLKPGVILSSDSGDGTRTNPYEIAVGN